MKRPFNNPVNLAWRPCHAQRGQSGGLCRHTASADEADQRCFRKAVRRSGRLWRASTTGILDRALNEWRAGQPSYDVIEGNKGPQLILKSEGVFIKFPPPSAAKFPKQFLEPDALLTPWRFNPISIPTTWSW
jgi:hypothetical protein